MGAARALMRSRGATIERLTTPAQPTEKSPHASINKNSFERVRVFLAERPTQSFRVMELAKHLDMSQTSLNRTVKRLLGVGAIEKAEPGKYRARGGYKPIATVREEVKAHIAQHPPRVVLSEAPFAHGARNGISAVSNWTYFRRHCASMRERMAAGHPLTEHDLSAFDELQALAFGPEKT